MRAVDPRVTYAELCAWPDDGKRYELYDGEVIVVPAPNFAHQRIIAALIGLLKEYERRTGGAVVAAPFDIVLSQYDVLQPDVVYFTAEKRAQSIPGKRHISSLISPSKFCRGALRDAIPDGRWSCWRVMV